jgi:hypothetical protein
MIEANAWIERYRELWEKTYQRLDNLLEEITRTGGNPEK